MLDSSEELQRVLIVEDDDARMEIFNKVFEDDDVTRAIDAERGVKWIREAEFDLVMLDHDLALKHYGGDIDQEGTGQDVAHAICALPEKNHPFVFVHSWNPDGSRAIGEILNDGNVEFIRRTFGADIGTYVWSFRRHLLRLRAENIGK